MTSLFAASGKDFPATLALHAFAEAVFFVTTAHMGLKRTFRQRILSSIFAGCAASAAELAHRMPSRTQANLVVYSTDAAWSRKRAQAFGVEERHFVPSRSRDFSSILSRESH
jgi:hypothetical protein